MMVCDRRQQENNMHQYKPLWHTLYLNDVEKEDLRLAAGT